MSPKHTEKVFQSFNGAVVGCILLGLFATLLLAQTQSDAVKPDKPDFSKVHKLIQEQMAARSIPAIQTYKGNPPLTFSIAESGEVLAKLGSNPAMVLKNARFGSRFGKQFLEGRLLAGALGTGEDTGPDHYDLDFELYRQDQKLYGTVTTRTRSGSRFSARLSYWVELEKQPVQSSGPLQR